MATTQKKKLTDAYQQYATGGNQEGIKKLSEYKNIVNQGTSALSNLNTANQTALKYADTAMQAQGFSTQGANTQNITNLQNAYMNQVGQQNIATQQQVGQLKDTTSTNAYNDYINAYANAEATGTLDNAELSRLQNAYFGLMNSRDLANAETFTRQGVAGYNKTIDEEAKQEVFSSYNIATTDKPTTIQTITNKAGNYAKAFNNLANSKNLINGDIVKVKNNKYLYYDGEFYEVEKGTKEKYTLNKDGTYNIPK